MVELQNSSRKNTEKSADGCKFAAHYLTHTMKTLYYFLLFVILTSCSKAQSSDSTLVHQDSLSVGTFDFITNLPNDWYRFGSAAWDTKYIPLYAGITVSTLATIAYDREMYDPVKDWYQSNKTVAYIHDRGVDIGDGKFQFGIAIGFGLYGWAADDKRALRTASQVTEVILAGGAVVQVLKHITGRESPFVTTAPSTGRWDFFPNQIEYHKHVPHYDAFPSGHVTTALATLTVVCENYPEATWLPYVGYPAVSLLALGMVGQGIHWVSDYPLAIALGYGFGQIVAHKDLPHKNGKSQSSIYPILYPNGTFTLNYSLSW